MRRLSPFGTLDIVSTLFRPGRHVGEISQKQKCKLPTGNIFIWDYNTQTLVKQFEVPCCQTPERCADL